MDTERETQAREKSPKTWEMLAELAQDDYDGLPEPGDLDDAPDPPTQEEAISRPGDVWVIGRHRLSVGDATDLAVVRRALGGAPGGRSSARRREPCVA